MKVIHVTESFATGVLQYLVSLTDELDSRGVRSVFLYSERDETPSNVVALFAASSVLVKLPRYKGGRFRYFVAFFCELKRLVKSYKPDVIHFHSSRAGFLGRIFLPFIPHTAKIFYSPHGLAFVQPDRKYINYIFHLLERLASIFSPNVTNVGCSRGEFLVLDRVLGNSVCVPNFLPKFDNSITLDFHPRRRLISVGRLGPQKNPKQFIEIFSKLRATYPCAEAIWIGDGDPSLRSALQESGVYVTGWLSRSEVRDHLQSGGLYVSTSLWEGLPLAVLEAMSFGLVPILSSCIGNRDIFDDSTCGYIFEDVETAVDRITLLFNDHDVWSLMAKNSMSLIENNHSVVKHADQLMDIYAK